MDNPGAGVKSIFTENAPAVMGAYSQAVVAGDYIFISGQLPVDPQKGTIVEGNITVQTIQAIKNVDNILRSCGIGLEKVVKSEVFLVDMGDFEEMNETYATYFSGEVKPARFVVQASGLPKNARIELACTAYLK